MGFWNRFRNQQQEVQQQSSSSASIGSSTWIVSCWEDPELQSQVAFFVIFVVFLLSLRLLTTRGTQTLSGQHVLNIHNLNDVLLIKEVFLAYLNAAILEPILSIGNLDSSSSSSSTYTIQVITNLFELLSLCWWVWLVTDAFDCNDVMFQYKFHYEFRPEIEGSPNKFSFLRLRDRHQEARSERKEFLGSIQRDVALWFSLAAIGTAWILPGKGVSHTDVLHAYVIVILWTVIHHYLRRATCWGSSYFYTFIFPSTALMPMEYCCPLMDTADIVGDVEFVATYREFLHDRTGVELIIET
ncbi:hypothetical protein IV203_032306 [Nitzschia inconspicua]|uniref:Uncharacterized protein n=1 Tax=Nitzschia inconspicua TaxID=303405 RepID=A0A9K3KKG7_9STRA|nr:hypothetical protein IV203_032306 [Nitzschia inconspicua]